MNMNKKKALKIIKDFAPLFDRTLNHIDHDYNEIPYFNIKENKERLLQAERPDELFFKYCNIPYEKQYQKIFNKGSKQFAELIALWHYGFRDYEAIKIILRSDKFYTYANEVFSCGIIGDFVDAEDINKQSYEEFLEEDKIQTCFSFDDYPLHKYDIHFWLSYFNEIEVAEYLATGLKKRRNKNEPDPEPFICLTTYMYDLPYDYNKKELIPVIKKYGFSIKTCKYIQKNLDESFYYEYIFESEDQRQLKKSILNFKKDFIEKHVPECDILYTDGKKSIIGIFISKEFKHTATINYIGKKIEIPLAKKIAKKNKIKVINDPEFTRKILNDNYRCGENIVYFKEGLKQFKYIKKNEKTIKQCDVIITDNKYTFVGLKYDKKNMQAPKVLLLSENLKNINETAIKYKTPIKYHRPLARLLFEEHDIGEEINNVYYNQIASIYSEFMKK